MQNLPVELPQRVATDVGNAVWTLVKWSVERGKAVYHKQRVARFECSKTGAIEHAFAPHAGMLDNTFVKEGECITSTQRIACVKFCPHSVVYSGVCAVCGEDVERPHFADDFASIKSRLPVAYNSDSLTVTRAEAETLASSTARTLYNSRCLSLVLDLDHTLVHATDNPRAAAVLQYSPPNTDHTSVASFTLDSPTRHPSTMHVKLRPNLKEFLSRVAKKFQLHIYTMGSRLYADQIANLIDPDKSLFHGRITSREDFAEGRLNQKSIQRLFPCSDSMVLIVDDREDVWISGTGQPYMPNLIRASPYTFWQGQGDAYDYAVIDAKCHFPVPTQQHPVPHQATPAPQNPQTTQTPVHISTLSLNGAKPRRRGPQRRRNLKTKPSPPIISTDTNNLTIPYLSTLFQKPITNTKNRTPSINIVGKNLSSPTRNHDSNGTVQPSEQNGGYDAKAVEPDPHMKSSREGGAQTGEHRTTSKHENATVNNHGHQPSSPKPVDTVSMELDDEQKHLQRNPLPTSIVLTKESLNGKRNLAESKSSLNDVHNDVNPEVQLADKILINTSEKVNGVLPHGNNPEWTVASDLDQTVEGKAMPEESKLEPRLQENELNRRVVIKPPELTAEVSNHAQGVLSNPFCSNSVAKATVCKNRNESVKIESEANESTARNTDPGCKSKSSQLPAKVEFADLTTPVSNGNGDHVPTEQQSSTKPQEIGVDVNTNGISENKPKRVRVSLSETVRNEMNRKAVNRMEKTAKSWWDRDSEPKASQHLLRLAEVMEQCHSRFFASCDAQPEMQDGFNAPADVKQILANMRGDVLKGCTITFTGVVPIGADPSTVPLWNLATRLGADCQGDFVKGKTTHLVASDARCSNTQKCEDALKSRCTFVVTTQWLEQSALNFQRELEYEYRVLVDDRIFTLVEYQRQIQANFTKESQRLEHTANTAKRLSSSLDHLQIPEQRPSKQQRDNPSEEGGSRLHILSGEEMDAAMDAAMDDAFDD